MSLDYVIHCDNWTQIPKANAQRTAVHGLRNAVREAARLLMNNREERACRVFLPKNDWYRAGDEVAAVVRTSAGLRVRYNPKFRFQRP